MNLAFLDMETNLACLWRKLLQTSCGFRRSRTLIPEGTRTPFRAEGERFYDSANLGWDHKGQMVHSLLE